MKKCPFCGADIEDSARFCLHCMQSLTEKEQIPLHKKKKPQWIIIIAAIVTVFLTLVIVLLTKQIASKNGMSSDDPHLNSTQSSNQTDPSSATSVTDSLHIHSYSVENTDIGYQKEKATCIAPAVYYYSCLCGEKGSETFSSGALGEHDVVTESGYPANCVNAGLTDGMHCSICKIVFLAQTKIPVVNHTFDNDRDEICNVCNFVRTLNCNHSKTVKLTAISPTCTASGLTEGIKCSLCEDILTTQTAVAPLGHIEVTDQAIAPTCTADGKTEGKHCATCDAVLVAQVAVAAKGHTEVIDPAVAATCTTDGKTEGKHCATCNAVLVAQVAMAAKGHTEVIDPAVAATCTTDGKTEGKHCATCNAILVTQVTVAALGHIEVIDPAVPATCTASGKTEGKHCAICKTVFVAQVAVAAKGHTYYLQNTASEYLLSEATCVNPAIYYYSCICGEAGSDTFSYGPLGNHTVVIDPYTAPVGCTISGWTEGSHCSVCQQELTPQYEVLAPGHTFSLGDTSSTCLTCRTTGPFVISSPELPVCLGDTFRIDNCTYTIRKMPDNWEIKFSINYTNISSNTTNTGPTVELKNATWGGPCQPETLLPGQSGTCLQYFYISHYISNGTYNLVFK